MLRAPGLTAVSIERSALMQVQHPEQLYTKEAGDVANTRRRTVDLNGSIPWTGLDFESFRDYRMHMVSVRKAEKFFEVVNSHIPRHASPFLSTLLAYASASQLFSVLEWKELFQALHYKNQRRGNTLVSGTIPWQ